MINWPVLFAGPADELVAGALTGAGITKQGGAMPAENGYNFKAGAIALGKPDARRRMISPRMLLGAAFGGYVVLRTSTGAKIVRREEQAKYEAALASANKIGGNRVVGIGSGPGPRDVGGTVIGIGSGPGARVFGGGGGSTTVSGTSFSVSPAGGGGTVVGIGTGPGARNI